MFDRIRQFRAMIHDPRFTRADLLTFAILAFGTPDREGCHPAEATIAAHSRQDRKTVRAAVRHLADLDAITVERRHAGRRVVGTLYSFPGAAPMGESTPRQAQPMEATAPIDGGAAPHPMGEAAPPIESPVKNRTGTGSTDVVDLEAEQLARRVQQASAGPWRLDNARRAVLAAIERAGIEAVRRIVSDVLGAGLRAYEITARLEATGASRAISPASVPSEAPKPSPKASPLVRRALALLEADDPSTRIRWHNAAKAAGSTAPMFEPFAWVPAIAAVYMQAEHWREWQAIAA